MIVIIDNKESAIIFDILTLVVKRHTKHDESYYVTFNS